MKDIMVEDFQDLVSELLTRHRSILDQITKFQDSNSRVNRAIVKAATNCGCIRIDGKRQSVPESISFEELQKHMDTHVRGELCPNCREIIEKEMGRNIFYLTSLCNTLDLSLYDILIKEKDSLITLGRFHLR
ncbi:MAG: DUF1573 domain-containing protein [Clostridia bacterium]|jgi:hypothetical protein